MTETVSHFRQSIHSLLENALTQRVVEFDTRAVLAGIHDDAAYNRLLQELLSASESIAFDDLMEEFWKEVKICTDITDLAGVLSRFTSRISALKDIIVQFTSVSKSCIGELSPSTEFLLEYLPHILTERITIRFCKHAHMCDFEGKDC